MLEMPIVYAQIGRTGHYRCFQEPPCKFYRASLEEFKVGSEYWWMNWQLNFPETSFLQINRAWKRQTLIKFWWKTETWWRWRFSRSKKNKKVQFRWTWCQQNSWFCGRNFKNKRQKREKTRINSPQFLPKSWYFF
jgi:hypothetical protein